LTPSCFFFHLYRNANSLCFWSGYTRFTLLLIAARTSLQAWSSDLHWYSPFSAFGWARRIPPPYVVQIPCFFRQPFPRLVVGLHCRLLNLCSSQKRFWTSCGFGFVSIRGPPLSFYVFVLGMRVFSFVSSVKSVLSAFSLCF